VGKPRDDRDAAQDLARELAVHSQLYALSLRDPSPQVTASLEAFRLRDWFRFRSDGDRKEPTAVSETSS
jgi:hypothetical protein